MICAVLKKYVDLQEYKVFYFGSRVLGNTDDRSDIDVGIEGKHPLLLATLANIKEDIENLPLLYTIDIVDFTNATQEFLAVAGEHREYIN